MDLWLILNQIAPLLHPIAMAGNVKLNEGGGGGWYLFGGTDERINQTQVLDDIDGTWKMGPTIYEEKSTFGQCIVQVIGILFWMKQAILKWKASL